MKWNPFRKKSLLGGADRIGMEVVQSFPGTLGLWGGESRSYAEMYRKSSQVRAVVDFLAVNVASTPLHGFIRSGDDRDRLPPRDPLEGLLRQPNAEASGFEWRRDVVTDLATHGNSFSIKVRADDGRVAALVRVDPSKVSVVRTDETEPRAYDVRFGGVAAKRYPAADVLHFRLHALDGILGVSPLESLRDVLAEDREAVRNREGHWKNAGRQGGVVESPADLEVGDPERARLRESLDAITVGPEAAGKTLVLYDGMKFNPAQFSARESEYLGARDQVLRHVAGVYGVPLALVGSTDRNWDAQQRGLVLNTLSPWYALLEEVVDRDLVPDVHGEQAVYDRIFVEHVVEQRSRGNFRQHADIVAKLVSSGVMTPGEARKLYNLPARKGDDVLFRPPNAVPIGGTEPEPE